MINLVVQFYKVNYDNVNSNLIRQRQDEITFCFKKNLLYKHLEKIHFLYENYSDVEFLKEEGVDINDNKIKIVELGKRLTYSDVFDYANKNLVGKNVVYMHSDMCLDRGFENLQYHESDNCDDGSNNKNSSEKILLNKNKIYALTAHNLLNCGKTLKCGCVRQFYTPRGLMTPTIDGFAFTTPIKQDVIDKATHIVHHMGSENRLVAILKNNGYIVECPNMILYAIHLHNVKVFAKQHAQWIEMSGECKPLSYYQQKHREQANLPYEEKIVGGGIPFYLGTAELKNQL